LLPPLAETLSALVKSTVNDASSRELLANGLAELLAQEKALYAATGLAHAPTGLAVPRDAVESVIAFLRSGSSVGLSGCVRGDTPATVTVRVVLRLEHEVPLSLSVRAALAHALVCIANVDRAALSDLVIPADASQLTTQARGYGDHTHKRSNPYSARLPSFCRVPNACSLPLHTPRAPLSVRPSPPHAHRLKSSHTIALTSLAAGFCVRVALPANEPLAEELRASLAQKLGSVDATNELLREHVVRCGGLPCAVVQIPDVSVVARPGKVPTTVDALRAAGADALPDDERERLHARCFQIDLTFGEAALRSTLLVYFRFNVLVRARSGALTIGLPPALSRPWRGPC
jgi:hypothetical protein